MNSEQEEPQTEALEGVFTNEASQYWLENNPVLVETVAKHEDMNHTEAAELLSLVASGSDSPGDFPDGDVVRAYLADHVTTG